MSGSNPLNKFVDEPKKKIPGKKVISPPGGKGEDFLSSKWLDGADEPTLKHCQEERNRSQVFSSGDQQPEQTASPLPPGGSSHGIFGGAPPVETTRTSTKVLHRPGGETHNIFGLEEDEEEDKQKKPGKRLSSGHPSHNIFGADEDENLQPKANRKQPGGETHGIFGGQDTETQGARRPPGGTSSLSFGSDNPVEKPKAERIRAGGIFGRSESETQRNSSRVLKPPGGGSSNIFG